jgi:hypothetical protein
MMRIDVPKIGALVSIAGLTLFCSCEKHQLGEMPPAQKEHVDLGNPSAENSDVVKERSTEPNTSPNPTPAEFFPSATPH